MSVYPLLPSLRGARAAAPPAAATFFDYNLHLSVYYCEPNLRLASSSPQRRRPTESALSCGCVSSLLMVHWLEGWRVESIDRSQPADKRAVKESRMTFETGSIVEKTQRFVSSVKRNKFDQEEDICILN